MVRLRRLQLASALAVWMALTTATRAEDPPPSEIGAFVEQTAYLPHSDRQLWTERTGHDESPAQGQFGLAERINALTRGRVQLEGGYIFTYDRGEDVSVTEHALPDLLLRIGLTERLELRVGWPGYRSVDYGGDWGDLSYDETLDPNVGFMFDLWQQSGWRPQTALSAAVPIAMEDDPLVFDSLQPVAQLLYLWYLNDRWSIGGTTGMAIFEEYGDRYGQLQQSLDVDYVLSDRLGTFVQWTVLMDHGSEDDGSQHLLSAGLARLWTERFQTSLEMGAGLNQRAPDFLAALRFAYRF
ncbi:MAG: transporter [Pirellulales bacterium]|nr:transporter [Pirellulales bacterium]